MKPIELRAADFKREIIPYSFTQEMKDEFFEYWTEPNKSGTKMRFELEKTWALGRRLARWARSGKDIEKKQIIHPMKKAEPTPVTDVERLDAFIDEYRKKPADIPFELFGAWYDFMKARGLLRKFSPEEVAQLLNIYCGDKMKCRCAAVQKTLNGYINNGLKVSDLLKARV